MLTSHELYESYKRDYPNQILLASTFTTVLKRLIDLSVSVANHEKRKDLICDVLHHMVSEEIHHNEITKTQGDKLTVLICAEIDEYYDHHSSTCCLLS